MQTTKTWNQTEGSGPFKIKSCADEIKVTCDAPRTFSKRVASEPVSRDFNGQMPKEKWPWWGKVLVMIGRPLAGAIGLSGSGAGQSFFWQNRTFPWINTETAKCLAGLRWRCHG